MASPATTDTDRGSRNPRARASPARAAKTPLWVMSARNGGPPAEALPLTRIATAASTGTAASTASSTRVRRRRNTRRSSLLHIEPLPGEGHEGVLQARHLRGEGPDPHPRPDQGGGAVLGLGTHQVGPHHPGAGAGGPDAGHGLQ